MPIPETSLLDAARIEALFASDLSTSAILNPEIVAVTIRDTVRRLGGAKQCACVVAQEVGDHPDTALPRLLWARAAVAAFYIDIRGACRHRDTVPARLTGAAMLAVPAPLTGAAA